MGKIFLPSEKNGDIVMQRVIVPFHVKLLLPFAEAVQTVVSVVRNLQIILPSTFMRSTQARKKSSQLNTHLQGHRKVQILFQFEQLKYRNQSGRPW